MPHLFPCIVMGFIVGLVLGSWFTFPHPALSAGFITLFFFLSVGFRKIQGFLPYILIVVLFVALGGWHAQRILPRDLPPDHIVHHISSQSLDIEGVVVRTPQVREDRTRIVVDALRIYKGMQSIGTRGLASITIANSGDRFQYGDRIRLKCRLRPPAKQGNPGGFNWKRHLALQGIYLQGFVKDGKEILFIRHHQLRGLRAEAEWIRRKLSTHFRNAFPTPSREILQALVVGERWAVPSVWREAFSAMGVSHLLAISGLHLGLLALISYRGARWLLLRSSWLIRVFPVEKVSWGLALPVLAGYALLAGMQTSTRRALIMIVLLAMCFMLDRVRNLYHAIAFAALLILLIRPASIYEISFQLSFLAVVGIIYAVPRWKEMVLTEDPLKRLEPDTHPKKIWKWLLLLGLSSAAALMATTPVTLLHFHRVPVAALPANIILVPLVGFVILPLALAGSATFLLLPSIGTAILWVVAWIVQGMGSLLQLGVEIFGAGLFIPSPRPWEVFMFYALCVGITNLHRSRHSRWIALGAALSILMLWCGEFCIRNLDGRLRLHCLSVGNGLSVLIEGPGCNRMLVDGGGTYHDQVDIGALQVAPVLWHRRIRGLDRVILSHPHPDHMNGLRFVVTHFKVDSIWDNGDHPDNESYRAFRDVISQRGHTAQRLIRGMRWQTGQVTTGVLHPPANDMTRRGGDHGARANNASAVLKMTHGGVSFLLTGDIEAETEAWLVQRGKLKSTVLFAPHHGSRTSSTEAFIEAVSPKCVVFSSRSGWWELVHPEVLRRYRKRGILTFHTGEDGMVSFETDGRTLQVKTYLSNRNLKLELEQE